MIGPERLRERVTSYWDDAPTDAKCLLRPATTEDLSRAMRLCHERGQTVVVQGGLTGLVRGAVATPADVIVSLERMNAVETIDTRDGVAVVQAGAILQTVQERAAEQGLLFPLDFGARGTATIGGATSTNAGGLKVLRYGMMRNLVLGLEAVLADGTIVSSMNRMLKNNTGYDLKQLFIGSEGTLGIVTRVVVKLHPLCTSRQTAMLAVESFDAVVNVLQAMRSGLGGTLSAFEVMWNDYYSYVTGEGGIGGPLAADYPCYILVEAEGNDADADDQRFERLLERGLEAGDILDAVLPKSTAERDALWLVREEVDTIMPAYPYDVSLPIKEMPTYIERLGNGLATWRDDALLIVFGHIADGNLHIMIRPDEGEAEQERVAGIVYGALDGLSGSISAEHGIGLEKKQWLGNSRSAEELALMKTLKSALDPKHLLNPGRVID